MALRDQLAGGTAVGFFFDDVASKTPDRIRQELDNYQNLYKNELETYLVSRCMSESTAWNRDYSSLPAYETSVASIARPGGMCWGVLMAMGLRLRK